MSLEYNIKEFNIKVRNLLRYIHYSNDPEIQDQLERLYRQSIAIEYLIKNYAIAISGLQGVGKSTLLKEIYDIPNNVIPTNLSVGEKVAVLVTETQNESEINKTYKHFINEEKELKIEEVPKDSFDFLAKDPDKNIVFLQIKVKPKVFNSEDISFLLLPGFELEKDHFYQTIESYLFASAFCIFVTNSNNYAVDENRERLEKVLKNFEGNRPIVVLTRSGKDRNQELKKTVLDDLKIMDFDRVICSGTFSDNPDGRIWKEEFINSVNKYKRTKMSFVKQQVKNLKDTIGSYRNNLKKLDEVIKHLATDINIIEYSNVKSVVQLFEDSTKELREKYLKNIKSDIESHKMVVNDGIRKRIIDKPIWKKLLNLFFTSSLKEKDEIINEVKFVWNSGKNLQKKITSAINKTLKNDKIIKSYKIYDSLPEYYNGIEDLQLFELENSYGSKINQNLRTILLNKNNGETNINEDYKKSIQIAPRLLLEYIRINTLFPDLLRFTPDPQNKSNQNLGSTLNEQAKYNKDLLTGIAVLLGIDSIDGELDSFNAFIKALNLSKSAVPYANMAEGLFITGSVAIAVIKHLNKHDMDKADISQELISRIGEKYYEEMESIFDESMEDFIKLLKMKLEDRYSIGPELAKQENLLKAYRDLKYSLDIMQESLVDLL